MEIKIDLLRQIKIKNKFAIYGFTIVVLLMIILQFYAYDDISDLPFPIFWSVWGLVFIYQIYSGKRIDSLFGKAYIHINSEFVKYRPTILQKEKSVNWKDAEKIENKQTYIEITDKTGESLKIEYKHFEYLEVVQIKEFVEKLNKK